MAIVYNLANKTGLTSGESLQQLREIIRELGSEANQIENAYQPMANQFEQALKIGNAQLKLDQTAQNLNQTSHGLMDVSNYLVASAKNLKNGNGSAS